MLTTGATAPDITAMSDAELATALQKTFASGAQDHGVLAWNYMARYVRTLIPAAAKPALREYGETIPTDPWDELRMSAVMIRTWVPEVFPKNEFGQMHFIRIVMDSIATNIEIALASIPQPVAPHEPFRDAVGRHHGSSGQIAAPIDRAEGRR